MSSRAAREMLCFFVLAAGASITARLQAQAQAPASAMPYQDPVLSEEERKAVPLGDAAISILGTAFWRDWMPIVSRPGPDGGSPLRGTLRFWLDNSKGEAVSISCKAVVVDAQGKSYPVTIQVQPNFRVLPEETVALYREGDPGVQEKLRNQYRVMWDGWLKARESREVALAFSDGPYLPANSAVHAEVTWTYEKGLSVRLETPRNLIKRTD